MSVCLVPAEECSSAVVPLSPGPPSQETLVPSKVDDGGVEEVMAANRNLLAAIRNRDFKAYK